MANTSRYYQHPTDVDTGPEFFFSFLSGQSNGLWGHLILVMVFSITYLSLSKYNSRQSFAAASFATFVTTVLMLPFNGVGGFALTLTGVMVAVSIIINRPDNRGGLV